ncbi:MAG: phosphoglycerate mutase family protein [Clostridia bacterium]|nr:phosphoglycerate mutase family protein [Clostridia bacterium]
MKIFLIRHGESIANVGENYKERILDSKVTLTENGIHQALVAGRWLKEYCDINGIDLNQAVIWRSPYKRTIQTCDAFNQSLKIKRIKEDVTLVEQRFGLFDCIPDEELPKIYPVEFEEFQRQKKNGGKFFAKPPMGEAPYDVAIRIHQFFGTIRRDYEKHGTDTLFVFTHGTTLRCFLMRYFHYTLDWYEAEHNPKNCWVRLIDGDKDMGYIYNQ